MHFYLKYGIWKTLEWLNFEGNCHSTYDSSLIVYGRDGLIRYRCWYLYEDVHLTKDKQAVIKYKVWFNGLMVMVSTDAINQLIIMIQEY